MASAHLPSALFLTLRSFATSSPQASTRSHRLESSLSCILGFTLAFPDCFPCHVHEQPFKCKPNLHFLPPEKRKNSMKSQSFLRFSLNYRPTESVAFPQQSWLPGPPLPLGSVLARPSSQAPFLHFLKRQTLAPAGGLCFLCSPTLNLPQTLRQLHC